MDPCRTAARFVKFMMKYIADQTTFNGIAAGIKNVSSEFENKIRDAYL